MTRSEDGDSVKPIIPQQQITENRKMEKLFFLCDKLAVVSEREIKITEKITVNEDGKNTE